MMALQERWDEAFQVLRNALLVEDPSKSGRLETRIRESLEEVNRALSDGKTPRVGLRQDPSKTF